ncbi:FAD/NAD-P-binding domain-containing protein [Mycena latifolia]|nr:FAD/NAD-P-binding domain-containing protein [Mycena latifolia]
MVVFHKIVVVAGVVIPVLGQQIVFDFPDPDSPWTTFPNPIKRVAVIGAGPSGLQAAAHLIAANFTIRLFERAPSPGGNWFYTEETPAREAYPGGLSKEPGPLPKNLPATIYYEEGDDGMKLEDRWKEHWQPRPVWYDLHTNTPPATTKLPGIEYPPNVPWRISVHDVQRHVRAYASLYGLNSNDHPSSGGITSYSTVVVKVEKCNSTVWTLTLRRLEWLHESNRMKAELWTEDFDAVIVATSRFTSPYIPAIEGITNWSKAMYDGRYSVYHAQSYRHPERYSGKTVLIVGGSVSATQISGGIVPFAHRVIASVRTDLTREKYAFDILHRFPNGVEIVPEISSFEPLDGFQNGIKDGKIRLINGTILEGIDEIILATGYRQATFLPDIVNPPHHWTGHYIHDPTLAYTSVRSWTHGGYQSYGFAKVWTGKARLPNQKQMLEDYEAGKYRFGTPSIDVLPQEAYARLYVAWLNSESLELGGQFVEPLPVEAREIFAYFVNAHWKSSWLTHENYTRFDDLPASEWPEPGPPSLQSEVLSEW